MAKKVAVQSGEGGVVAFSYNFVKVFFAKHRATSLVYRVIVKNSDVIAGYHRATIADGIEIFRAVDRAYDNVAAAEHLFKVIFTYLVGDFGGYAGACLF
jgi:hypothetical protein